MSEIPTNEVTEADRAEWYRLKKELDRVKGQEMQLRLKIYRGLFVQHGPEGQEIFPKEGTTSQPIENGWVIKAQRVVNREVDKATLTALTEEFRAQNIPVDSLIEYKPSLKVREYRTLTEEQRQLFDQALVIKDGSPQLEIMLPKKAAKG